MQTYFCEKFNLYYMKKKICLLSSFLILSLFSCAEHDTELVTLPGISITKTESVNPNEYSALITPDENAAGYRYILTDEASVDGIFSENTEFTEIQGNGESTATFSTSLLSNSSVIVAAAFDADGNNGAVAVHKVELPSLVSDMTVEVLYTTHCSAGIKILWNSNFSHMDVYFGTKEDEEAFRKGELVDTCLFDFAITDYYVNKFELQPETEYVLYAKGFDRYGSEISTIVQPVKTLSAEECPSIEMTVNYVDVYKADLTFKAGSDVDSMWTMPLWEGPQQGIDVRNGDIIGAMESYIASFLWGKLSTDQNTLKQTELNSMYADSTKYFYAIAFSGEDRYLYRFGYSTPSVNPDAPKECKVNIEVSDTTFYGADYIFTFEDDVFAFLYGTIDADAYDSFKETSDWYEYYINDYLGLNGTLVYKDDIKEGVYTCRDSRQQADKRVYVVVAPINENGYEAGWMPATFQEYTTLSRN